LHWVGLGQSADGLGWGRVTQNGPMDNSDAMAINGRPIVDSHTNQH